jgi:hypothetical protein
VLLAGWLVLVALSRLRPTTGAGRQRRAGVALMAAGLAALPWAWWSDVPEMAVVAGAVLLVLGWPDPQAG